MLELGVNIDHVATLRNARGDFFPSMVYAAAIAEENGADFITIHLREDRRHINDDDLVLLNKNVTTYINLEMACNEDVLDKALKTKPYKVTLVPEKREEVTTEGGLNIEGDQFRKVKEYTDILKDNGIKVSLFIEPDVKIIDNIVKIAPHDVEIHTGCYSLAKPEEQVGLLEEIRHFARTADEARIKVCAGHGLTYHNVQPICKISEISELNIGYSIICRAIFSGLGPAVKDMKRLIREAALSCTE